MTRPNSNTGAFQTTARRTISPGDVIVAPSPDRGRGVFAARRFEPNETIEVCPVIALSESDAERLNDTGLYPYYFGWGPDGRAAAIALGYGSLYNHSDEPNAEHRKDPAQDVLWIVATRVISAGEEIFIRYQTGAGNEQPPLWFEAS